MQTEKVSSHSWPVRMAALAYALTACYSVYLAMWLLLAHCEGFSCTYLGMAWLFWVGILCLPTTVVGYFVRRFKSLPLSARTALHFVWLTHTIFSVGLLLWWLVHRF
jgi:hypothetical protein